MVLKKAIESTFENRNFTVSESPVVFKTSFIEDAARLKMWEVYLRKLKIQHIYFSDVIKSIMDLYLTVIKKDD
jgi:hypothetical protein